jgi:hypothetical protein
MSQMRLGEVDQQVVASHVNWVGVALALLFGVLAVILGLATVRDWRGFGSWYYRLTVSMPFSGWYRGQDGRRRFDLWIGGGTLVMGLIFIIIVIGVAGSA